MAMDVLNRSNDPKLQTPQVRSVNRATGSQYQVPYIHGEMNTGGENPTTGRPNALGPPKEMPTPGVAHDETQRHNAPPPIARISNTQASPNVVPVSKANKPPIIGGS